MSREPWKLHVLQEVIVRKSIYTFGSTKYECIFLYIRKENVFSNEICMQNQLKEIQDKEVPHINIFIINKAMKSRPNFGRA